MTRQEAKALAVILTAYGDGKTVQRATLKNGWEDIEAIHYISPEEMRLLRIKPESKRIPLTAEDIPPVCWIRYTGNIYRWLVTKIEPDKVWFSYDEAFTYTNMMLSAEYSTDLKTWKPCYKEVNE